MDKDLSPQGQEQSIHVAFSSKVCFTELGNTNIHINIMFICICLYAYRCQVTWHYGGIWSCHCIISPLVKILQYGHYHLSFAAEEFNSCCLLSVFTESDSSLLGSPCPLELSHSLGTNCYWALCQKILESGLSFLEGPSECGPAF